MLEASGGPTFKTMLENDGPKLNLFKELMLWVVGQSHFTLPGLLLGVFEQVPKMFPANAARMVEAGKRLRKYMTTEVLRSNSILLFPPHPTVAPHHNVPLRRPFNFVYTAIINAMELPSTQVPLGLDSKGIPLGVQVVGMHHHDHLTVAMALELERAFGGWVPPPVVLAE
jgi:fatty acid amide hydrolase 2